jgi:TonB family protein
MTFNLVLLGKKDPFLFIMSVSAAGHILFLGLGKILEQERPEFSIKQALTSVEVHLIREKELSDLVVDPIAQNLKPEISKTEIKPQEKVLTQDSPIAATRPIEEIDERPLAVSPSEEFQGVISEAKPLEHANPAPVYPQIARRRGWEGTVYLRIFVDEQGAPENIKIHQSSGHDVLDQSALHTVSKWMFSPAIKGNKNISSWVIVPVKFQLINQ